MKFILFHWDVMWGRGEGELILLGVFRRDLKCIIKYRTFGSFCDIQKKSYPTVLYIW